MNDYEENKKIVEYFNSKKIECYFWLPVFAEIIDEIFEFCFRIHNVSIL